MVHSVNSGKAAKINPKKGFRIHLLVFLLVTPAIWLVWNLSLALMEHTGYSFTTSGYMYSKRQITIK